VTPNAVAWAALGGWPLAAIAFFAARRDTRSVASTTAWAMVLPVMFLPSAINIHVAGFPPLDKHRLSFLAIAIALELFHPRPWSEVVRGQRFARLVLLILVAGWWATTQSNRDALTYGQTLVPGMTDHDFWSISVAFVLDIYLPFTIGQRVFRTERDLATLLGVLARSALIYAPFFLFEVRMSPQLNYWIYGYQQHAFAQTVRWGGYRPWVFMNHPLSVAFFMCTCLTAAIGLRRARVVSGKVSTGWQAAAAAGLVLLAKSVGSFVYAAVASLAQLVLSRKLTRSIIAAIALAVVSYPAIRASGLLPTADIVAFVRGIEPDRSESLLFRFMNEEEMLDHARARPLFGWGNWSRNEIFDSWGTKTSVTDGYWIIALGTGGYVNFGAFFALLVVPLFLFLRYQSRMEARAQLLCETLALIVAVSAFDLLPNSRSDFLPLAYAGALHGLVSRLRHGAARQPGGEVAARPRRVAGAPAITGS
jgi:hypothetical protein